MCLSPIVSKVSKKNQPKINNKELSLFNSNESEENNVSKFEKKFGSHLIKFSHEEKKYAYSYKLKKMYGNNKITFFECNNIRCKGKGEYDIEKKIFVEKDKHNIAINNHKIVAKYFNARDILLNDNDCNGYQLLKDFSFIKDKEVISIK